MSGQIKSMTDAIKGEGGGLQSISSAVGDTIAGGTDTRSGDSKKADEATSSLNQLGEGAKGQVQSGTNVSTEQQITNQQTGTGDHLGLGYRKD